MNDQPFPPPASYRRASVGRYRPPNAVPPRPQGGGYRPPSGISPRPQGGGYRPPSGISAAPGPLPLLPAEAYTPWLNRVGAQLIDTVPVVILVIVSDIMGPIADGASDSQCLTDTSGASFDAPCGSPSILPWLMIALVASILILAYGLWNWGYRQGTTGSSVGKSLLKFKVVSEKTGQPIGFGLSVVRHFAHIVDALTCYIGFLFPLWDAKRQTLADKIMTTVCLPMSHGRGAGGPTGPRSQR